MLAFISLYIVEINTLLSFNNFLSMKSSAVTSSLNCTPLPWSKSKAANSLLSWLSADPEAHHPSNIEAANKIKRSISFLSARVADCPNAPASLSDQE